MYLFVFAFLGNTFYVASILTSPNMDLPRPEALAFLKESTPYVSSSLDTIVHAPDKFTTTPIPN
jgi:hypothetical protein